mmetsp:Transcript_30078/g.77594  ORF Transcript_30078/g.77594 Transcript_30078/m.77594 type:complete len:603 (-) Transcript_30078:284-2092(-)
MAESGNFSSQRSSEGMVEGDHSSGFGNMFEDVLDGTSGDFFGRSTDWFSTSALPSSAEGSEKGFGTSFSTSIPPPTEAEDPSNSDVSIFSVLENHIRKGEVRQVEDILAEPLALADVLKCQKKTLLNDIAAIASRRSTLEGCLVALVDNDKVSVNDTLNDGSRLLHEAARAGNLTAVVMLLTRGANPDALNADSETALHAAALAGSARVVSILAAKCDVDKPSCNGSTALHYAVEEDRENVVHALLQVRPNISAVNKKGMTPLMLATNLKRYQIVGLLSQYAEGQPGSLAFQTGFPLQDPIPFRSGGNSAEVYRPRVPGYPSDGVRLLGSKRRRGYGEGTRAEEAFYSSGTASVSAAMSPRSGGFGFQSAPAHHPQDLRSVSAQQLLLQQSERHRDSPTAAYLPGSVERDSTYQTRASGDGRVSAGAGRPPSSHRQGYVGGSASATPSLQSKDGGGVRRLPPHAVEKLEEWVKKWRVGEGSNELQVERGWTKVLADQTGLEPHQVKDWVRRYRSKKLKAVMRESGIEPGFKKRLSTTTLHSEMARAMEEVATKVAAKKNAEIRALMSRLRSRGEDIPASTLAEAEEHGITLSLVDGLNEPNN